MTQSAPVQHVDGARLIGADRDRRTPSPIKSFYRRRSTGDRGRTDQAGAVYVLRWTGADWSVAAQSGYLWAPVTALHVVDLSGDGRPELVAVDASGGVSVLEWVPGEYRLAQAWQWPRTMGRALAVTVAELDESGVHHLVVADDGGRVSVWAWPLAEPLSQAFVGGRRRR